MFEELIHAILEQWAHVTVALFAGLGVAKILSVLIPIAPAAYGIYVKWRNSGYRLVDRLDEFLAEQETKVSISRRRLSGLLQSPPIDHTEARTAFQSRALSKALRKMDWGFGTAAPNDLSGAVMLSAKRAEAARKLSKEHEAREALAHLLQGAKAAARQIDDPAHRCAARSEALEEFDKALKINPRDADALEYSAMMLLELNEPNVAMERIDDLISLRKREADGGNLGRAHRLEALAYENMVPPKNIPAYRALLRAVMELPPGSMIDCAVIYEHLAIIAQKLGYPDAPERHLRKAWDCYHKMRDTAEGTKGFHRVSTKLAAIESTKPEDESNYSLTLISLDADQGDPRPARTPSLFSKLTTKPNG